MKVRISRLTAYRITGNEIPIVPFKYNTKEKPLLRDCKELQDGINMMLSVFQDNMETDSRSTILVLTNYDGQNLGEFRENLCNIRGC